ncbi:MAG: hypothetical protein WB662_15230 [Methyloceanibacter sp.]
MELKAKLFARKKPNDRHYYAYDVEFDGDLIVQGSRDPEHDLARSFHSLSACLPHRRTSW